MQQAATKFTTFRGYALTGWQRYNKHIMLLSEMFKVYYIQIKNRLLHSGLANVSVITDHSEIECVKIKILTNNSVLIKILYFHC